ncbi:hypothetical protein J1N35_044236 [Gossypium stocksii]|uniref:Uncharacterized protein n=1 Tax=Gossypium stocksii TaxID=47602 RepID=A0A9D3ZFY0_9ROSI|nr:hypothetical protein J1N35_044236 [Gossypium stocksii]
MPAFLMFPKELLLEPDEENDEGEEPTTKKQTTEHEGEVEKTKFVHVESEKEDDDVTQAPTPAPAPAPATTYHYHHTKSNITYDSTRTCSSSIN